MKFFTLTFYLLAYTSLSAQPAAEALNAGNKTLNDRFQLMKEKSQTFQDYKVIKGYVLDGFWKIVLDSVVAKETSLRETMADVDRLRAELDQTIVSLKQKEQSMKEIVHASTHIAVLGIDFNKSFFITLVAIITGGLLLVLGLMTGRLKMIYYAMKDKAENFNTISHEYEEYKHKALEKQMKLSRELQNERNKFQEFRSAH